MNKLMMVGALALAQAVMATGASAGIPLLVGSYILHARTLCQASQSIDQSGSSFQFTPISPGQINAVIGTLNFTPDAPGSQSGKVDAKTTTAIGSLMLSTVNGVTTGSPMSLGAETKSHGKFAIVDSTLTLKFKGMPGQTYDATFGALDPNSVTGELDGVTVSKRPSDCSTILRLDRQ